jgi:hypothetical protein
VSDERARLARAAMVIASALLLASAVVLPANSNDIGRMVDIVVRHRDRVLIAALLGIAAQALLLGALLGLRGKAPAGSRLAAAGLACGVLGVIAGGLQGALGLFEWQMAAGQRGEMVALLHRLEFEGGTPFVLVAVGLLPLGLVLLAAAARAPVAARAGLAAGAVVTIAGYELPSLGLRIAGVALTFAALCALAYAAGGGAEAPPPAGRSATAVP